MTKFEFITFLYENTVNDNIIWTIENSDITDSLFSTSLIKKNFNYEISFKKNSNIINITKNEQQYQIILHEQELIDIKNNIVSYIIGDNVEESLFTEITKAFNFKKKKK